MPVVDVMMGRANQVPYDQQSDMSEIQRRQLLLQQMLKEAGQPTSGTVPGSGKLVLPNYAGAIGKVLESVIGVAGSQNAAEEQRKVTENTQRIGAEEAMEDEGSVCISCRAPFFHGWRNGIRAKFGDIRCRNRRDAEPPLMLR